MTSLCTSTGLNRWYGKLWGASLVAPLVKNLSAMQETLVQSLGWGDPLEEGMATHSSILCLKNPHWQMSLTGYCPWGHKESDTTKQLSVHTQWSLVQGWGLTPSMMTLYTLLGRQVLARLSWIRPLAGCPIQFTQSTLSKGGWLHHLFNGIPLN